MGKVVTKRWISTVPEANFYSLNSANGGKLATVRPIYKVIETIRWSRNSKCVCPGVSPVTAFVTFT